jgi:uncharacterized protein YlxW (UPF0749 family)
MYCSPDTKEESPDPVNHPPHYMFAAGYEVKDVIRAWQLDFFRGNAVKYVARAGKKGGAEKEIEDLQKAVFYLNDTITDLESKLAVVKEESKS